MMLLLLHPRTQLESFAEVFVRRQPLIRSGGLSGHLRLKGTWTIAANVREATVIIAAPGSLSHHPVGGHHVREISKDGEGQAQVLSRDEVDESQKDLLPAVKQAVLVLEVFLGSKLNPTLQQLPELARVGGRM